MSRQVWKGSTLLNPEPPVLVSCGAPEKPNLITVGWTGTICTQPPMLSISVRPERYSHHLIQESGEFVVNLPTESLVRAIDWCGVKSGRDVDKFAAMHLTAVPAAKVGTVLVEESPVNLECKVTQVIPLGSHDLFLAECVAVDVDDNDMVAAGQTLVRLDPVDARLAYERSLVALASAVRDNCRLQAQLRETEAAIRMRRVDLRQKADNLTRREALGKAKAIGAEELKHARDDRENAAVALAAAEEERNALAAVLLDTGLAEQPAVRQAAANVRDCWLALQRTTVLSPAAGQIAKRGVQAGEVVSPGTPLMTVIPLHRLWIDANFKEVQLHKMRIGQPAVIRVDMYGGDVTYHGRVTGFSAGTGSAFSLLPPQNATGNWIKIVQRVPVRIEIDPADLREHPLLVGLSAVVKVDTSDTSGRLLAASARTEPVPGDLVSQAPAVDFAPVEATISGIIRDNALPGVCPVQGKP